MRLPDVPDPGQVSFAPAPIVAAFDAAGNWHIPGGAEGGRFAKPGVSGAKAAAVRAVVGLLAREHARDAPEPVRLTLRPGAPADLRGRINSPDGAVLARYKNDQYAIVTDIHKRDVLVPWDRFADPDGTHVEVPGQHKLPFRSPRKPKIQPLGDPTGSRFLSAEAIRSNRRKHPEMNALWERLTEDEFENLGSYWLPSGTVDYSNGGYRNIVGDTQNWAMDQSRALDQTGRYELGVVDHDLETRTAAPRWFLDAILAMDDYTGPDNWVSKGGGADRVELVLDRRNDPAVLHPARPADRAEIKALIEPLLPNGKAAIFAPVRRDVAEGAAAALAELPEADRRHVRFFTFGYETELQWAGASATPAWWSNGTSFNPKVVAPGMHIDMNFNWSGQTDDWFEIRAAATKALRDEGKLGAVSLGTFEGITDPDARARLSVMHEVGHAVDFTAMSNGSVKDLVDQMQYDGRGGDIDSDALIDRRLDGVVTTPYGATTPLEAFAEAYAIHHSGVVPEAARPSLDRLRKAVERRSHQASEGMPIVNELADRPSEPVTGPTHLVDYFDGTHGPELVSLPHAGTDRGDAGPEGSRLVDEAAPGSDARSDRPAAPLNLDGYDAYKAAFRDGSIFDPKYAEALSRSALSPVDIPGAMIAAYGGFIGGDVNVRGFARLIAEEFGREDRLRMVDEVPRDDPARDWETVDKIFAGIGSDARFDGKDVPVPDRAEARRMVRALYDHTQAHLASLGYEPDDRVLLYRGLSGPSYTEWNAAGRADHLDSPPFTAFTHDPEVATRYSDRESGGVVTVEARVGDIFSIGLKHDYETVMLAPTGEPGFHVVGFSDPANVDAFYKRWPTREAFLADNPEMRPEGNHGSFVTGTQSIQDPERIIVRAGGPVSAGIAWADNNGIYTPDTIDAPGLAPGASFEELARRSAEAVADRLYPRPGATPIVNELTIAPDRAARDYATPGLIRWARKLAAAGDPALAARADQLEEALRNPSPRWGTDKPVEDAADALIAAMFQNPGLWGTTTSSRLWIEDTLASDSPDPDALAALRAAHLAAAYELGDRPHRFVRYSDADGPFAPPVDGVHQQPDDVAEILSWIPRPEGHPADSPIRSWARVDGPWAAADGYERFGKNRWEREFTADHVLANAGDLSTGGEYLIVEDPAIIERLMTATTSDEWLVRDGLPPIGEPFVLPHTLPGTHYEATNDGNVNVIKDGAIAHTFSPAEFDAVVKALTVPEQVASGELRFLRPASTTPVVNEFGYRPPSNVEAAVAPLDDGRYAFHYGTLDWTGELPDSADAYRGWASWAGNYAMRTMSNNLLDLPPTYAAGRDAQHVGASDAGAYDYIYDDEGDPFHDIVDTGWHADLGPVFKSAAQGAFADTVRLVEDARQSPPTTTPLYRGIGKLDDTAARKAKRGDIIQLPLTAWSPDEEHASMFMAPKPAEHLRMVGEPLGSLKRAVLYTLEPGAHAVDANPGVESVTYGTFVVVDRKIGPSGEARITLRQTDIPNVMGRVTGTEERPTGDRTGPSYSTNTHEVHVIEPPGAALAPVVNEMVDPLALSALAEDPVVSKITSAYTDAGHPVYIVGGAIRSVLQGQAPNDIDLTTPALPAESTEILDKVGTVFPLGEKFGTVVVNIDGMDYEVTTHRTEVYDEDSRKPVTQFTTSLADDLARRDFTFNAMALDTDGTLIDPFGGQEDLAAGVVRAVGDPDERFSEDPLRTIRAVRFAAVNGFSIDPETAAAARRQAERLDIVSRERFGSELDKIMKARRPGAVADAVRLSDDLGITEYLFGALDRPARNLSSPDAGRWKNIDDIPPEHRFAALVMASGLRPADLIEPMKRGRVEMRDIADSLDVLDMLDDGDPRRAIRAHTDEAIDRARAVTDWAGWRLEADWSNRDKLRGALPINGNDLIAAGLTGRDIRTALEAVEKLFLARNGDLTREEALAAALGSGRGGPIADLPYKLGEPTLMFGGAFHQSRDNILRVYNEGVANLDDPPTPEEFQTMVAEAILADRDDDFVIRVPWAAVPQIVESGAIKSQHETGVSSAVYSPDRRAHFEEMAMGVPRGIDPALRPVYGAIEGPYDDDAKAYGDVMFVVKREVARERATMTFGDSLDHTLAPIPVVGDVPEDRLLTAIDDWWATDTAWRIQADLADEEPDDASIRPLGSYREFQMHGGVTLDMIDYVVYAAGSYTGSGDYPDDEGAQMFLEDEQEQIEAVAALRRAGFDPSEAL